MARPVLIVAHPGHELRLFGWMERQRPLVCILTDGSGSAAAPRTSFSVSLIESCRARIGPVMGEHPDRDWYAAIVSGTAAPFIAAADKIARAAAAAGATLVVADPVEGYNPMHDLCAALADRVAAAIGAARATYPLMRPAACGETLRLDPPAEVRKLAAIKAYLPLADEAAALLRADRSVLATEQILPHAYGWPAVPDASPEYEVIGASRMAAGIYDRPITYAAQVRPLALQLRSA